MSTALKVCPQCGTEYPANARFCEVDGTALRSAGSNEDLLGSIVADRYHVLKKLGEGGMGQVYLVEHVKMGRKSALKVMHPSMGKDVDAISRFNREAANASRISHPNVASVYDFGETSDGIIYLAMEFVDGPPLTSVIQQQNPIPAKRAAEIVRQTGEALAVAHDMGIVHRDLKPDNIMIARTRDGADLVKVVDFGIAKAAGNEAQKVTKTGLVVGTPEYMSPEQLAGDKLDGRSDIYSLGLVAFNMLTGVLPFPSESAQESMIMRLTDRPKTLTEMRPDISWPADVQAVMDKALERDAAKRYQTATDFGRALYQAIDRMPASVAAGLGTEVIGRDSVPATRVGPPDAPAAALGGPPAAPPAGAFTQSVPTPASGSANAAPARESALPRKKSMIPLLGGIAAVVVVGIGAVFMMRDKPQTADPTPAQQTPAGGVPTSPPGASTAPPNRPIQSTAAADTIVARGKPPAAGPPTVRNLAGALAELETDAADSTRADGVLAQLTKLSSTISAPDDRARVNFIRFKAYTSKNDGDAACTSIKRAVAEAVDPALKQKYQERADLCR